MKSKFLSNVAIAIALAGVTATAQAGIKASAMRPTNWSGPVALTPVPLNAAGAVTLSFNLPQAGKKVLTYTAECAVAGPAGSFAAWVDIDIVVNGVVVAPTVGSLDSFCASNATAGIDGWTRASITVVIQGIAGNNNVQIQSRGNSGATSVWLGDTTLVIHD